MSSAHGGAWGGGKLYCWGRPCASHLGNAGLVCTAQSLHNLFLSQSRVRHGVRCVFHLALPSRHCLSLVVPGNEQHGGNLKRQDLVHGQQRDASHRFAFIPTHTHTPTHPHTHTPTHPHTHTPTHPHTHTPTHPSTSIRVRTRYGLRTVARVPGWPAEMLGLNRPPASRCTHVMGITGHKARSRWGLA
jgi:hypothetical protein